MAASAHTGAERLPAIRLACCVTCACGGERGGGRAQAAGGESTHVSLCACSAERERERDTEGERETERRGETQHAARAFMLQASPRASRRRTCCTDSALALMNSRHASRASCGAISTASRATPGQAVAVDSSKLATPRAALLLAALTAGPSPPSPPSSTSLRAMVMTADSTASPPA